LAEFLKSSPLKPLCQMNQNLVGSIYDRFSMKIAHFIPIRWQTWPPQEIRLDSFGQTVSKGRFFRNQPVRNKNCLWWPCLVMDHNKMYTPSIDVSYQVSIHLAKRFQRSRI
jgi:hypothetical protein